MAKPSSTTGFLATGNRAIIPVAKLIAGFIGGEIPPEKFLNELLAIIEEWLAWIDTDVVDITSDQAIGGDKTFTNPLRLAEPLSKEVLRMGTEVVHLVNVVLPDPADAANAVETFEYAKSVNAFYVPGVTTPHTIRGVDTGDAEFTINGDYSGLFAVGRIFDVTGSTGNDGGSPYTVTSVSVVDGNTVIGVAAIADATVDGNIDAAPISITGADTGTDKFTVLGDVTGIFIAGRAFLVAGSTGNDATYIVLSSAVNGSDTDIFVAAVADATADGTIDADAEWQAISSSGGICIEAMCGSSHAKATFSIPSASNPGIGVSIPKSGSIWVVSHAVRYGSEVSYGQLTRTSNLALASGSFIKVTMEAEVIDEASLVNLTVDGLEAPTDGLYHVDVTGLFTLIAVDTQAKLTIGSDTINSLYAVQTVTNGQEAGTPSLSASVSATVRLSAGDKVNAWAQNGGGGSGIENVKFRVTRLRSFNP